MTLEGKGRARAHACLLWKSNNINVSQHWQGKGGQACKRYPHRARNVCVLFPVKSYNVIQFFRFRKKVIWGSIYVDELLPIKWINISEKNGRKGITLSVRHKQARYITIKKLYRLQLNEDLIDRWIKVIFLLRHFTIRFLNQVNRCWMAYCCKERNFYSTIRLFSNY